MCKVGCSVCQKDRDSLGSVQLAVWSIRKTGSHWVVQSWQFGPSERQGFIGMCKVGYLFRQKGQQSLD